MTDDRDRALSQLTRDLFPLPEPPREAMWEQIQRARQAASMAAEQSIAPAPAPAPPTLVVHRVTHRRRLFAVAAGMAAMLVVGVGIGRSWREAPRAPAVAAAAIDDDASYASADSPRRLAMETHLARTEVWLTTLRTTRGDGASSSAAELTTAAHALLGTTRLLLDDPSLTDATTRNLLLDLELVLAQLVQDAAARDPDARRASRDAVQHLNLLPRLRASGLQAPQAAFTGPGRGISE